MKKIFIVTFQNAYNYGAVLQCYALQQILMKKTNKDVKVLNYDNVIISNVHSTFYKPLGSMKLLKWIKSFIKGIMYIMQTFPRNKKFKKFIKENINLTEKLTKEQIINKKYDSSTIFVAGSDQIWNTNITNGYDSIYTLDFAPKNKKISYAASIGLEQINSECIDKFRNSLKNFSDVSVREKTAKEILQKIIDKCIDVVLDPTLLLSKNEWESEISSNFYFKDYIFVYMPDNECINLAKNVQKQTGKKIIYIDKKNLFSKNSYNAVSSDPFDFINYIKNADLIITTSFHATIFSIIFNKMFWVIIPKKVGSRILDLLKMLNLENRGIMLTDKIQNAKIFEEIDYTYTNKIIEKERKKCIKWLIDKCG